MTLRLADGAGCQRPPLASSGAGISSIGRNRRWSAPSSDVLDPQSGGGCEAAEPRAFARGGFHRGRPVLEDAERLGVFGLQHAAIEVVADRHEGPVSDELFDDDVVAQVEVRDLAVRRSERDVVDEVIGLVAVDLLDAGGRELELPAPAVLPDRRDVALDVVREELPLVAEDVRASRLRLTPTARRSIGSSPSTRSPRTSSRSAEALCVGAGRRRRAAAGEPERAATTSAARRSTFRCRPRRRS
jgi:hypothetical protein